MLVRHGFTPMEAIQSATRVAAQALALADVGTLEVGKAADVIAVRRDPLGDITVLQDSANVQMVMRNGQVLKAV
jgi:imidazolonepropionase-like amidohydrolase